MIILCYIDLWILANMWITSIDHGTIYSYSKERVNANALLFKNDDPPSLITCCTVGPSTFGDFTVDLPRGRIALG